MVIFHCYVKLPEGKWCPFHGSHSDCIQLDVFCRLGPRSRAKFRRDSGEVGLKHIAAKTSLKDVEGISTSTDPLLQL